MNERGVHTDARVEREQGRYVVYLDTILENRDGSPAGVRTTRINDYPTERLAAVAASWFERAARRENDRPPSGL